MEQFALAVDIGSSAVRSAVIDSNGAITAVQRVDRQDASGVAFDPRQLWRDVRATIGGLSAGARRSIGSICIAGHVGTVFADAALEPVSAGRGWADSSGVTLLAEAAGSRLPDLLWETGRPAAAGGAGAAFLDLARDDPDVAARIAHVLTPKDYVIALLTGSRITDRTSAAYSGLSRLDGSWSEEMLGLVGLEPDRMPIQRVATDVIGVVLPEVARELGIGRGVPVVAGGTDGTVGAALIIAERIDVVADISGTTDVLVRRIATRDEAPDGAVVNPYPFGGLSAGGPTGTTGGALAYWAQLLGFDNVASALAHVKNRLPEMIPGAGGLVIDPSISGSRFPRWRPEDTGSVLGQREEHRAEHLLLAAAEGAAYVVREGVDRLDPVRELGVVLAGGTARSQVLAQLRADVLGRDILVCSQPEITLLGAASIAFRGTEIPCDVKITGSVALHPSAKRSATYEALFADWSKATLPEHA
ncbi:xylulokinase [Mycobacterium sp. NPDC003449]